MTVLTSRTNVIQSELDAARQRGPLRELAIPACPVLLRQMQAAIGGPEPDLTEMARIAASDVAMSATLIRRANGARFAGLQNVQTVGQALTRLGMDMSAAVMTEFLAARNIRADFRALGRFWEQSSLRAAAMGRLAERLPGLSPDLAHTTGLFLHVGLPVMLQSFKGYGSTMIEALARRDRSFIQTENANHRTDHAVVGALVARVWQLAPQTMAAVRLHHEWGCLEDDRIEPEVRTLVALAFTADHLLRAREGLGADAEWQKNGPRALAWLQLDADEVTVWRELVLDLDAT